MRPESAQTLRYIYYCCLELTSNQPINIPIITKAFGTKMQNMSLFCNSKLFVQADCPVQFILLMITIILLLALAVFLFCSFYAKNCIYIMLGRNGKPKNPRSPSCPQINVSKLVREACSVFIQKGRFHSTASKLYKTKGKCTRMARELQILERRFKLV